MKKHELIYSLDAVNDAAEQLFRLMSLYQVFTFTGSLGAGKTTLVQALLRVCGIEEPVQSPTFTYFSRYTNTHEEDFFHFDLYRLKSAQDFVGAGFHEFLYQPHSWALIEWPEIIMPLLRKKACHVVIDYQGTGLRKLTYYTTD